jgi:DNA-binding NtrC family response regulator
VNFVNPTVLVVDDDLVVRNLISEDLPAEGFDVLTASNCNEAKSVLKDHPVSAILLDYRLPDEIGPHFFKSLKEDYPRTPVIFVTNFPDVNQAVSLMKEGVADYVMKPFTILELANRIRRAIENVKLKSEVSYHRRRTLEEKEHYELIGDSSQIQTIRKAIDEIAVAKSTSVLISGETGTGKEVVAHLIHQKSCGAEQPFVEVDCSTIPKFSFETILFGDEEMSKVGIFEVGKEGTIFLDQISEIDLELQNKLLRVLETRRFRRIGGAQPMSFEARIIATSNRNLKEMIEQNKFRSDLYYRLAGYVIQIPPLREHKEDIPSLADCFLKKALEAFPKPISGLSKSFLKKLQVHAFPGNVRELKNLVEQAVIQTEKGEVDLAHFHAEVLPDKEPGRLGEKMTLLEGEKLLVEAALKKFSGNKAAAARHLGISRPALLRRLEKLRVK